MRKDLGGAAGACDEADFDALLALSAQGAAFAAAPSGPRSRRRASHRAVAAPGLLAALLAAEGCKTTGDAPITVTPPSADPPAAPAGPPPSGGSAPVASPSAPPPSAPPPAVPSAQLYAVAENESTAIPVSHLVAGYPEFASIMGLQASEGIISANGGVITFTPFPGQSGPVTINYSYLTTSGHMHHGSVTILVDDDAAAHQAHAGHPPPSGAAGGHDHGGSTGSGQNSGGGSVGSGGQPAQGGGNNPPTNNNGGHNGHQNPPNPGGPDPSAHQIHPDDPSKASEHMALLDLVPRAAADFVAVKNNGSWFDPSTWADGVVPGAGAKVLIPEGVTVRYDGESSVGVFTVRVDGALKFATDRDTLLKVDTLVVSPTGTLTVGTENDPVQAHVKAVISIDGDGPINTVWDPQLLSRGVISHGAVEIHGAQKASHVKVAADPMRGDTSVTLDAAPTGWKVGDKIVIAGTKSTPNSSYEGGAVRTPTTQDEELTITAINGNVVHFDRPLAFDHDTPRADLKTYVANYTRNVVFETADAASTPVHERGHVMFMHSDNVDVRYAEFFELGRTDKATRAFDLDDLASVRSDSNLKGRYSLHLHRTGTSDADEPAIVIGNAVWGSPGWGFVHHDSHALFANNASYDVFGAAFVAELGTETGRWANNISIRTAGVANMDKDGPDTIAFDLGRNGAGFWFQGRMVEAVGNIAAGAAGGGFVYAHRAPTVLGIEIDPSTAAQSEKLRYADISNFDRPNISIFRDNEAFAVETGLHVFKSAPPQGHDVRSMIVDFKAWEVMFGVALEYTSHYTLSGIDIIAASPWTQPRTASVGMMFGTELHDTVLIGASIEGFDFGIFSSKTTNTNLQNVDFHQVFIDVSMSGVQTAWTGVAAGEILSRADIPGHSLAYTSAFTSYWSGLETHLSAPIELQGTKVDSLGTTAISTPIDPFMINIYNLRGAVAENGYWSIGGGKHVTVVEEYVADRVTGELIKVGIVFELPPAIDPTSPHGGGYSRPPAYNGVYDANNAAPIANPDHAFVRAGERTVIDVLANDVDPEGKPLKLSGVQSQYGFVVENDDGTLTYMADPGQSGQDTIFYWVEDDQGNFTRGVVNVSVEI